MNIQRIRMIHSRVRGFSLIELLTVIAVIAVLAAILIPAVGRVRENANRAGCASNMRQIMSGTLLQLADLKNRFPYRGDKWDNYGLVAESLLPYVGDDPEVFNCPSNVIPDHRTILEIVPSFPGVFCEYEFNSKLATYHLEASPEETTRRSLGVISPGDAAYVFDRPYWKSPSRAHGDGVNVGFMDGHVAFLTDEDLDYNNPDPEKRFYNRGHDF